MIVRACFVLLHVGVSGFLTMLLVLLYNVAAVTQLGGPAKPRQCTDNPERQLGAGTA
jgi:hypothetical protein